MQSVPITTDVVIRAMCTPLCDKVCQRLVTGRWFSAGSPVSSTNKTDRHNINEILLKLALSTTKQANNPNNRHCEISDCALHGDCKIIHNI
jgi:hypothetical protein